MIKFLRKYFNIKYKAWRQLQPGKWFHQTGAILICLDGSVQSLTIGFRTPALSHKGIPYSTQLLLQQHPLLNYSMLSTKISQPLTKQDLTIYGIKGSANITEYKRVVRRYLEYLFKPELVYDDFARKIIRIQNGKYQGKAFKEAINRESNLTYQFNKQLYKSLFQNSHLQFLPCGSLQQLPSTSFFDIIAYHNSKYTLSNSILVTEGKLPASFYIDILDCLEIEIGEKIALDFKVERNVLTKEVQSTKNWVVVGIGMDKLSYKERLGFQLLSYLLYETPKSYYIKDLYKFLQYPPLFGYGTFTYTFGTLFKTKLTSHTCIKQAKFLFEQFKEIIEKDLINQKFIKQNFYYDVDIKNLSVVVLEEIARTGEWHKVDVEQLLFLHKKQRWLYSLINKFILDNPNIVYLYSIPPFTKIPVPPKQLPTYNLQPTTSQLITIKPTLIKLQQLIIQKKEETVTWDSNKIGWIAGIKIVRVNLKVEISDFQVDMLGFLQMYFTLFSSKNSISSSFSICSQPHLQIIPLFLHFTYQFAQIDLQESMFQINQIFNQKPIDQQRVSTSIKSMKGMTKEEMIRKMVAMSPANRLSLKQMQLKMRPSLLTFITKNLQQIHTKIRNKNRIKFLIKCNPYIKQLIQKRIRMITRTWNVNDIIPVWRYQQYAEQKIKRYYIVPGGQWAIEGIVLQNRIWTQQTPLFMILAELIKLMLPPNYSCQFYKGTLTLIGQGGLIQFIVFQKVFMQVYSISQSNYLEHAKLLLLSRQFDPIEDRWMRGISEKQRNQWIERVKNAKMQELLQLMSSRIIQLVKEGRTNMVMLGPKKNDSQFNELIKNGWTILQGIQSASLNYSLFEQFQNSIRIDYK